MPRPVSLLPALVATATLLGGLAGGLIAGPAAAEPAAGPSPGPTTTTAVGQGGTHSATKSTGRRGQVAARSAYRSVKAPTTTAPLEVTIDDLTPSAIPRSGPIRVSGTVTNVDDQTWSTVNLYSFISTSPMTTEDELATAASVPEDAFVGPRITSPGPYDTIDQLAPGQSETYSMVIPRRRLAVTQDGVYWFGVHALGMSEDGRRDDIADGRARTFLPLVSSSKQQVDTALVVPVRHQVRHTADGRIARAGQWTRSLSQDGQLRHLVDFGVAAGTRPLTWLVDPAVVDAASQLAAGNPARSLESTSRPADPNGDGSDDATDSPSATPSTGVDGQDSGSADSGDTTNDAATQAAADASTAWLDRLHTGLDGSQVLGLPYGDVDVSAAAAHDPETYREAHRRTGTSLAPWGVPMSPAVSSPTGYLSPDALDLLSPDTRVLASDQMFDDPPPAVVTTGGHEMVTTSSEAAQGGPGPDDPLAPVAMRQRILSEAALRLIQPGDQPLVVVLPTTWSPASTAGFFEGLDVPWLHLTTVDQIGQQTPTSVPTDDIDYPDAEREAELNAVDFATSTELMQSGDTLQNLLTNNDEVGGEVRDEALTDVSYAARTDPGRTRASAFRSRAWIEARLTSVHVEAPKAVILSSGSGRFSAIVINDLEQPVTVRLHAATDRRLRIAVPRSDVEIGPHARTTILLNASSQSVGVHNVTLMLTDSAGTPLGSTDSLPIRSNRVSNVIWLILGTGVALLFATIVVRLIRRIRGARSA